MNIGPNGAWDVNSGPEKGMHSTQRIRIPRGSRTSGCEQGFL